MHCGFFFFLICYVQVRQLTKRNNRDGPDPFALFRNSRLASPTPSSAASATSAAAGSRSGDPVATPVQMEQFDMGNAATPTSPGGSNPAVFASHRNSIGNQFNNINSLIIWISFIIIDLFIN